MFEMRELDVPIAFSWDFLPPRDAHNRSDAAAAHWKASIDSLLADCCVVNSVEHIAFACERANLKNSFMIEADFPNFPARQEVLVVKPWMRSALEFTEYSDPHVQEFTCNHSCNNKQTCKHKCCKGIRRTTVSVNVKFRDGSQRLESICLLDGAEEEPGELGELDNGNFWNSPTRLEYHTPEAVTRISSQLRKMDYIYDVSDESDEDDLVDDNSSYVDY